MGVSLERKQTKQERWRKVEPLYLDNGKYACPECKLRDNLKIIDYDNTDNGSFIFVIRCSKCKTEFQVKKKI